MKQSKQPSTKTWLYVGLGMTILGLFIFMLGAEPGLFGLNRSPIVGFVQTAVFSFGLALICLGGYVSLKVYRKEGYEPTLTEDIGLRLIATGYLIAFVAAMADVFGLGTQTWPAVPFFGPSQAAGVVIGEIIIAIGFVMFVPHQKDS